MVVIFKTDVSRCKVADRVVRWLSQRYPAYRVNFDLDDIDHILRVEGHDIIRPISSPP